VDGAFVLGAAPWSPGRRRPSRSWPTTAGAPGSAPSLEELGALADPPLTKDAVAGRIRRLLAMADKRASDLGIPGTESNLTEEMADNLVG
ncbi:hypothetical protein ACWD6I_02860, partial [Streptomyces sp. NPDC002454]